MVIRTAKKYRMLENVGEEDLGVRDKGQPEGQKCKQSLAGGLSQDQREGKNVFRRGSSPSRGSEARRCLAE